MDFVRVTQSSVSGTLEWRQDTNTAIVSTEQHVSIRAKDCTYVLPNVLAPSTVVLGTCTVDNDPVVPLLMGGGLMLRFNIRAN